MKKKEPLKGKYRMELIENLKNNKETVVEDKKNWLNILNPFSSKY